MQHTIVALSILMTSPLLPAKHEPTFGTVFALRKNTVRECLQSEPTCVQASGCDALDLGTRLPVPVQPVILYRALVPRQHTPMCHYSSGLNYSRAPTIMSTLTHKATHACTQYRALVPMQPTITSHINTCTRT